MPDKSKPLIITAAAFYALYRLVDVKIRRDEYQKNKKNINSKTYVFSWHSGTGHYGYQRYPTDYAVGHMAVQFGNDYVSFWPQGNNKPGFNPLHLITNNAQLSTIASDIKCEGKLPDTILVIDGLDHALMLAALHQLHEEVRDKKIKFQVLHNMPWQNPNTNNRHHCATMANKMLAVGGFPVNRRVFAPWSTTPNTLNLFYKGIGAKEIKSDEAKTKLVNSLKAKTTYKPL